MGVSVFTQYIHSLFHPASQPEAVKGCHFLQHFLSLEYYTILSTSTGLFVVLDLAVFLRTSLQDGGKLLTKVEPKYSVVIHESSSGILVYLPSSFLPPSE
jgi:hypothetical protein